MLILDTKGFRKYVHQATDHEELLSFLLGQLIKERVQLHRHQRGENPEKVAIKINQLESRAKELEIYDVAPFLSSRLFKVNGFKIVPAENGGTGGSIEKVFNRVVGGEEL